MVNKAKIHGKYRVERTDGSSKPGRKHHECVYFVLDVTHDEHAIAALRAYARAVRGDNPQDDEDKAVLEAKRAARGELGVVPHNL